MKLWRIKRKHGKMTLNLELGLKNADSIKQKMGNFNYSKKKKKKNPACMAKKKKGRVKSKDK